MIPQISIIIPAYNVDKFIRRCLDSILSQSYQNFEIILVDDGSTDNSLVICEDYAYNDKRIKLIRQTNRGVSSARNTGLKFSIAEYICFVDSDDWLEKDFCQDMLNGLLKFNADLSICTFKTFYDINFFKEEYTFKRQIVTSCDVKNFLKQAINNGSNILMNNVTAKLFKRSILEAHQINFEEAVKIGEDALFISEYQRYINKAICIPKSLYCCNRFDNNESVTSSYIENYWDNMIYVKQRLFEINSYAVEYSNEYKYHQYLRVAIKAVCEEGKIVSNNRFFQRYRNIKQICNEKELEYYRMNFRFPRAHNKFYQLIKILIRFNMSFVLTCILTVVYGGKMLK